MWMDAGWRKANCNPHKSNKLQVTAMFIDKLFNSLLVSLNKAAHHSFQQGRKSKKILHVRLEACAVRVLSGTIAMSHAHTRLSYHSGSMPEIIARGNLTHAVTGRKRDKGYQSSSLTLIIFELLLVQFSLFYCLNPFLTLYVRAALILDFYL